MEELLAVEREAVEAADLDELVRISERKDLMMEAMSGLAVGLTGDERAMARGVLERLAALQEQNHRDMTTSVDKVIAEMGVIRTGRRVLQSYSPADPKPEAVYLDNVT